MFLIDRIDGPIQLGNPHAPKGDRMFTLDRFFETQRTEHHVTITLSSQRGTIHRIASDGESAIKLQILSVLSNALSEVEHIITAHEGSKSDG
jgi:hypothetical protein